MNAGKGLGYIVKRIIINLILKNADTVAASRILDSLLQQTHKEWICNCMLDGVSSELSEAISAYAMKDCRIVGHEIANAYEPGFYTELAKRAKGDYLLFIHDNAIYEPGYLEEMLRSIDCSDRDAGFDSSDKTEQGIPVILDKAGRTATFGAEYLLFIHLQTEKRYLDALLESDISESDKLAAVMELFDGQLVRELALHENSVTPAADELGYIQQRYEFFASAADWLFSLSIVQDEWVEQFCMTGEFICASINYSEGWLFFRKLYAQFLLDNNRASEARQILEELHELIPDDEEITQLLLACPLPTRLVIIDAGQRGQYLKLAMGQDFELVAFCDETSKTAGQMLDGTPIISLDSLAELYRKGEVDRIVVAKATFEYRAIHNALRQLGIPEYYVLNKFFYYNDVDKRGFADELVQVDVNKPELIYIETHIADHCNLNCKSCSHYCNLVKESSFADLEAYQRDIQRLGELYWNVSQIRLMGGEPLLNPQLPEFIRITRATFPIADISVVTNGLLITKQPDYLFDTMRQNRCVFHISAYPPIYERREELEEFLNKRGIIWAFSGETIPIKTFNKGVVLNNDYVGDAVESWTKNKCGTKILCNFLREGVLYPCGSHPLTHIFENHYDVSVNNLSDAEREKLNIKLYETKLDGWQINEILDTPHEACKYCNPDHKCEKVAWEVRGKANVPMEDWVFSQKFAR